MHLPMTSQAHMTASTNSLVAGRPPSTHALCNTPDTNQKGGSFLKMEKSDSKEDTVGESNDQQNDAGLAIAARLHSPRGKDGQTRRKSGDESGGTLLQKARSSNGRGSDSSDRKSVPNEEAE
ncbi:unnamed protein product [Mesocestoides corti]|uniref:Transcription factor BIM1 n=1 Tax=Mesocestoides corti TaxID=53468 RepID=A0A0R3U1J2_MESCO|nr:unnamed protein product [Mesocestoides corti]